MFHNIISLPRIYLHKFTYSTANVHRLSDISSNTSTVLCFFFRPPEKNIYFNFSAAGDPVGHPHHCIEVHKPQSIHCYGVQA
jgi:hypothetical protein